MRVSTTFLQRNIKEVLESVRINKEDIVLTNYGKPIAVILSLDKYEKIRQRELQDIDQDNKSKIWKDMKNVLK